MTITTAFERLTVFPKPNVYANAQRGRIIRPKAGDFVWHYPTDNDKRRAREARAVIRKAAGKRKAARRFLRAKGFRP